MVLFRLVRLGKFYQASMQAVDTAGTKQKKPDSTNTRFSLTWLETGKQSKQEKEGLGKWGERKGRKLPPF